MTVHGELVPEDAVLRRNIASFEAASDWLVEHHNAKWVIYTTKPSSTHSTRSIERLAKPSADLALDRI